VHTGWVFTRSIRNNAHTHVLTGLKAAVEEVPFAVTGLDFDNGSEFLTRPSSSGPANVTFTRSRPYKKNDQATIESKNNHLVRKYGFYYRYDTPEELRVLNRLWKLVNDRFNYLTPTKKPTGWGTDRNGRRLFTTKDRSVLRHSNFDRRVFRPAVKAAGLASLTKHDLRHTAASLAISSGANVKVVQRMLGHKTAP
jgi:integrase